jgi:hypothetical protein
MKSCQTYFVGEIGVPGLHIALGGSCIPHPSGFSRVRVEPMFPKILSWISSRFEAMIETFVKRYCIKMVQRQVGTALPSSSIAK